MQSIQHRAPVILDRADFKVWIDPEFQKTDILLRLLVPWAPEELRCSR